MGGMQRDMALGVVLVGARVAMGGCAAPGMTEAEGRAKLIGTWKMVSDEEVMKDGSTRLPWGPNGKAFLLYTADGYMCALLVDPDQPKWGNVQRPTEQEKIAAFDGSSGYCGRY